MPPLPAILAATPEEHGALYEFLHSGAIGIFLEGGIFMWPILILLILVVAVIIERYRSLKLLETDPTALRDEVV